MSQKSYRWTHLLQAKQGDVFTFDAANAPDGRERLVKAWASAQHHYKTRFGMAFSYHYSKGGNQLEVMVTKAADPKLLPRSKRPSVEAPRATVKVNVPESRVLSDTTLRDEELMLWSSSALNAMKNDKSAEVAIGVANKVADAFRARFQGEQ